MFEFRVYTPINGETFLSGRTLKREQAWEKASSFILNDPRWMDAAGIVENIVRADEEGSPLKSSTIDLGHNSSDGPPVAVDIFGIR